MAIRIYIRNLCFTCVLLSLMVFIARQPTLAAEPSTQSKRVLLLHYSYGANSLYAQKIRTELDGTSAQFLEIYDAGFMTPLPADEAVVGRYVDYLSALFPDQKLDLAVAIGGAAVNLFQHHRERLFPTTPMLAVAEQRRLSVSSFKRHDVIVSTSIDLSGVIDNILRVLPDTNNIAVVIGNSSIEQVWLEYLRAASQPFATRVAFTWFNELSFDDMLKRAATLPPRSAIFFLLLLTDAAGATHDEAKVFSKLHAVANAPIFSYYDASFGAGIVGGPLISVEEKSRNVANIALRMLRGETPDDIKPAPIVSTTPKFDWREMQRWGISEGRLPPGSEIHFRALTAWEQYRTQILALFSALLLQAGMICWLLFEHRRRHIAEVAARNTMSELTQMNRFATAGELAATIAHEVNQPLTGIVTSAAAAMRWLTAAIPNVAEARGALDQIASAGQRASDIVASVRAMLKSDPQERTAVDIKQLISTVLNLVRFDLQKHEIDVKTEFDDRLAAVDGNQVQLQQVMLNLVMNAIESMHFVPGRRLLVIQAKVSEHNVLHVSITDSGTGVEPSDIARIFTPLFTTKARGMGMGLSICQSIIENHNGRIWVTPGATRGSIFQFELPIHVEQKSSRANSREIMTTTISLVPNAPGAPGATQPANARTLTPSST